LAQSLPEYLKRLAAVLAVAGLSASAFAEDAAPAPAAGATNLGTVEVTGSRIKRSEAEGTLAVQVMDRKEIERAGYQSVEQLLSALSATETMGALQSSSGAFLTTSGTSTVSLRGLTASRTLVLVNGRRIAPAAGLGGGGDGTVVNINTIPLAAIERVEVLKDGASSVYGSDAVAGVVNFILRKISKVSN